MFYFQYQYQIPVMDDTMEVMEIEDDDDDLQILSSPPDNVKKNEDTVSPDGWHSPKSKEKNETYKLKLGSADDLSNLIDAALLEMDFVNKSDMAVASLQSHVKSQESKCMDSKKHTFL